MLRYHFTFFGMNHHVDRNKTTACKLKAIYIGDVDRGSSSMIWVSVEFTAFAQRIIVALYSLSLSSCCSDIMVYLYFYKISAQNIFILR